MSYLPTTGGSSAVYYAENDAEINAGSNQTLVSRVVTAAPAGTYLCLATFRIQSAGHGDTSITAQSGAGSTVGVIGTGTHFYNQDKMLGGAYSHTGGNLTVSVFHDNESGGTLYGLSEDGRFGTKLWVIGPV